ncbi:MAG TPA: adenosine deaminase [Acidobacteriaceae bacterium]|jgi:adenosine deaminase
MARRFLTAILSLAMAATCAAQLGMRTMDSSPAVLTPGEGRASRALDLAKKMGAPELYALLKPMPKGADLHMHLSGAIYAETFIAEGVQQGFCVDTHALAFVKPEAAGKCADGQMLASDLVKNQGLYDKLIDSFSMRSFVSYAGFNGHDQFFTTFDRFGGLKNVQGQWLAEVAARAASQNEQYLEIMNTPSFDHAWDAGYKVGWPKEFNDANHMTLLAKLRDQLFANGLRADIAIDREELAQAMSSERGALHCPRNAGEKPAAEPEAADSDHGCGVNIHFMYQVLRGFPPEQVFAQTLLGFELASTNPQVVGINFVRAEDRRDAMAEYHTEMLMLDYLHSAYPNVHISLHAGELAPGMVPPEGLTFHIREAVELGHAERIGHGIDVLYENHPRELLKEMATKHIMVEINLTSNDVILGVKGTDHPLAAYRAAGVPMALSTDDEGVSRIDLTHEYVKGAMEQNLRYTDLKQMARTSLEHAFLKGDSLWASEDKFTARVTACAAPITADSQPTPACDAVLKASEKAAAQWELERRFAVFESSIQ